MSNGSSIEAWLFILIIIASIIGVFVVGAIAVKLYRKFRPFEEEVSDGFSISVSHKAQQDGFFKILLIGLVLCSPALYYVYSAM
ncbi:hypothetical protein ACM9HF_04455 [Colwellia sp. RE-S-Sl-9]